MEGPSGHLAVIYLDGLGTFGLKRQ